MPEEWEESLKENIEFVNDVRVVLVFNVYNFDGKEEEKVYKLVVKALNKNPYVQFFYSSTNHSKIISSGNKMYIGSSNLTENATNNFEAGVIINDIETIKKSSSWFLNICILNISQSFLIQLLLSSYPINFL